MGRAREEREWTAVVWIDFRCGLHGDCYGGVSRAARPRIDPSGIEHALQRDPPRSWTAQPGGGVCQHRGRSGVVAARVLVCWLERQFLDAPVQNFSDIKFVFRGAGDGVDPAELAGLFAGFAEYAENFSLEAEFVDAAGVGVGGVEDLIRAGRDAQSPRRAGGHGAGVRGGLGADGGASVGGSGNIDGDLAEEFSIGVEYLDAAIAAIGDVDIVLCVDGDAVRNVELAGLVAGFAPGFEPNAVLVGFGDAGIDIAVADISVAGGVPSHVGDLAELAVDGRERGLRMLERLGAFVG